MMKCEWKMCIRDRRHACPGYGKAYPLSRGKLLFYHRKQTLPGDISGGIIHSLSLIHISLERALGRAGVTVRQSRVLEVWTDAGQVAGVRTDQEQIPAGKVILATGGCSYPATGSTGDGYRMAAQLGHTVIPPTGSLVPLEEAGTDCGQMRCV